MATAPAAQPLRITGTVYAIPVMDIDVGERLRPIDPAWAAALGQVIAREGQRTPIEVVNYKGKGHWDYTLVAGAHRLAAMALINQPTIEAIIVDATGIDRRMREVSENLWRRGLDPLDRAAFVAELHQLLRASMGVAADASPQSIAAQARWKKVLSDDAVDASDIVSDAYGFTETIGSQLGLDQRTIRRDLLLHRRLVPMNLARLRAAGHAVLTKATQLRALAMLDPTEQASATSFLLAGAKSVSEALGQMRGKVAKTAEEARLSAFFGSFARMSLTEKKGALAQLAGMLPAGWALTHGDGA